MRREARCAEFYNWAAGDGLGRAAAWRTGRQRGVGSGCPDRHDHAEGLASARRRRGSNEQRPERSEGTERGGPGALGARLRARSEGFMLRKKRQRCSCQPPRLASDPGADRR